MIRQMPRQISTKDFSYSIDGFAAKVNLENYTAIVRGKWRLLRGTDTSGNFTIVLIGPYAVSPDLTGYQILVAAGYQPVDAMQALGLDHNHLRTMQKEHRKRVAQSKAAPRRGNTNSLDDLQGK
ncbi:hypothetical protein MPK64_gp288 [Erwinia phage pEa_SNUABM_16]|uniref:Uncharacterized protein n=1 Tax=Erwinia phage pEa_SNUABM_16 TaxID=2869544 RepID=A0AAE8XQQ5_9CAUD|nr:hypothetical protein MPK64_gp288 [Erwinia phage pEa_SNUABM_16]UAW96432.1 hypothetical protein pEaSNUABM16_00288 [Erwinia phage pEa_SNUABM_16]